jgi:hypothetical protein
MDQTRKTLIYAGVAVVLALIAWWASPTRVTPDAFLDQGEPFFPDFTDPNVALSLEIVSFDEATGAARPFKVHFKGGLWTIPSHHDYPADAEDRLAKTAAGIIETRKDDLRSDVVVDHELLGVIDPLDESNPAVKGRGRRVTIRGRNDVVLADIIMGKSVEGRSDFKYVRVPGQKRVYAAKVTADLSTTFADWIDTDLLEIERRQITKVIIDDYAVDERTGSIDRKDRIQLNRSGDSWRANNMASGQRVDTSVAANLLSTLDELSIVGVRLKPAGLSEALAGGGSMSMNQNELASLQSLGYYVTRDGQLMSNEGEIEVYSERGIVYLLRFGEVLFGTGLSLTAGTPGEGENPAQGREGRYVFVTTAFDESLLPEPPMPRDTGYVDKQEVDWTDEDRRNKSMVNEHDFWERRMTTGRELNERLNRRYAKWYFVISGDSFDKLNRSRSEMVVSGL